MLDVPAQSLLFSDGERLAVRPLERSDRDGLAVLFSRLSEESRYRRFHGLKAALTPRELDRLSDIDHLRHEAIAAVDRLDGSILGVSRYVARADGSATADVAVEVADEVHGLGIGTLLGRLIVQRAAANGIERLEGATLWNNAAARALMRRLGFRAHASHANVIELRLELPALTTDHHLSEPQDDHRRPR
jgi:RimJ/RimL family protein N-acetyltransferase